MATGTREKGDGGGQENSHGAPLGRGAVGFHASVCQPAKRSGTHLPYRTVTDLTGL